MKLLGTATLALNRIWATKIRSLLTMLGVVIGVAAIVALTSIVDGASQGINKSLATLGTNQLNITAMLLRTYQLCLFNLRIRALSLPEIRE